MPAVRRFQQAIRTMAGPFLVAVTCLLIGHRQRHRHVFGGSDLDLDLVRSIRSDPDGGGHRFDVFGGRSVEPASVAMSSADEFPVILVVATPSACWLPATDSLRLANRLAGRWC